MNDQTQIVQDPVVNNAIITIKNHHQNSKKMLKEWQLLLIDFAIDVKSSMVAYSDIDVKDEICREMISRSTIGIKKYGKMLTRSDLTTEDWLQHLLEELMDAINYSQVLIDKC